ncbi:hypothetical protein MASR1M12_43570 [Erysipelotrichia bacterium]
MNTDKSALLHERASNITRRCEDLKDNEMFFMLQRNLRQAVEQSSATGPAPLVVTIIGGTGVGKSFIFSSLCATPEISPSSSSVRGYTKELFVAAAPEDRSLLPFSSDEAHYLPGLLPGAILIDTPDLDTINSNNARLARETIRVSDILIVVTTPDKRSNFAIHQNVVEWASRKRWFFVINKTDTAPDATNESLKKDLADRLQQIGFSVDPEPCLLSAPASLIQMNSDAFVTWYIRRALLFTVEFFVKKLISGAFCTLLMPKRLQNAFSGFNRN